MLTPIYSNKTLLKNMSKKPNILFIMTDQQRLSAVSAYGQTPCKTPHIDRLAAEGTLFENVYTTFPVSSPARASVLTGLYPHAHGVTANIHEIACSVHELPDGPHLLPRRLQTAGYSTGYTGKWHLGTERGQSFYGQQTPSLPSTFGFEGEDFGGHGGDGHNYALYRQWLADQGFEYAVAPWSEPTTNIRAGLLDLPTEATVPAFLVDRTLAHIEAFAQRDRPFYMALNFWGPHSPYHATREFVEQYRDAEIPPWPNYAWDAYGTEGPHHYKIHWDQERLDWDDWAMAVRYYYARSAMIDSQIGVLYAALEASGQLDNTVIIFTADHGETLGSHGGLLDKGWHHFEETHRIPMIVRMPDGAGAGRRRDELVSLADVYSTVLDLAGDCSEDHPSHGRSLMPLVRNESVAWRDAVVTEFLGLGHIGTCMKTLRCGALKYGYNLTYRDELYNLENDPHEMHNLATDRAYAGPLEELRDRLDDWMVETSDPALRMYRWHRRRL